MLTGREWFKNPGADEEAIKRLNAIASCPLPSSYLALLRYSNGGEGPLPVDPWNFCLDAAEVAVETEQKGTLREFFPDLFVIGTSGGGEAIAIDMRAPEFRAVVQFDMTNCDLGESVRILAPDFDTFLGMVGHSESAQ